MVVRVVTDQEHVGARAELLRLGRPRDHTALLVDLHALRGLDERVDDLDVVGVVRFDVVGVDRSAGGLRDRGRRDHRRRVALLGADVEDDPLAVEAAAPVGGEDEDPLLADLGRGRDPRDRAAAEDHATRWVTEGERDWVSVGVGRDHRVAEGVTDGQGG